MGLDSIISVNIKVGSQGVTQAGFGIPLILDQTSKMGSDLIRFYEDMTGVGVDFVSSDAPYQSALAVFSQSPAPEKLAIGKRIAMVAQVTTVTPDVTSQSIQHFIETINGVPYDFTSDATPTAAEVVTGLSALINADSACPATATGTTTLILTAKVPGTAFTAAQSANLNAVATTANHGPQEDLTAIQQVNDTWYCILSTSHTDADILNISAWTEAQKKIFVVASNSAGIITTSTTDIASLLKGKNYDRTALLYSSSTGYAGSAWAGRSLPDDPGSETWKFKTLKTITSDNLSSTSLTNAQGKNCNVYIPLGGVDITMEGVSASGEYIDVIRFGDWMHARLQERIYSRLVNAEKIPYTDAGVAIIEAEVRAQIAEGIRVGGISASPEPIVTVPLVADVPSGDKTSRTLNNVSFQCTLAGAIHKVTLKGTISV